MSSIAHGVLRRSLTHLAPFVWTAGLGAVLAFSGFASPVAAAEEGETPATLRDAITGGETHFEIRARAEFVDQDGVDRAAAYTERLRLAYGTAAYQGFRAFVELDDVRALRKPLYNAAGVHGSPRRAVVADPTGADLNQAYLDYQASQYGGLVRAGRQRIALDDHRFVGSVAWRQNEQTYDAFLGKLQPADEFELIYAYIAHINTVFGEVSGRNLDSDSHVVHGVLTLPEDLGKLTGFYLSLRIPGVTAAGSDTYGLRYEHSFLVEERNDLHLTAIASFALQNEGREARASFDAQYLYVDLGVKKPGTGAIGAAFERLGSDEGTVAFQTPLSTLHAWNGWADAFLVTPARGLEDLWVHVQGDLPQAVNAMLRVHWFHEHRGNDSLGREVDASLSRMFGGDVNVLLKGAWFDGSTTVADRTKGWVEVTYHF